MDPMTMAYTILAGVTWIALSIVVLKIAGADMMFALYRHFDQQGNDVFIANPNRRLARHWARAKDGVFTINGRKYITNPNKLLGLSDDMIKEVKEALSTTRKRIENRLATFKLDQTIFVTQINAIAGKDKPTQADSLALDNLKLQLVEKQNSIALLESKLEAREQAYYMGRKGAYLYIEGDPVPKDFYEWYTEMDCVQLENIIVRAQTKDPKMMAGLEEAIVFIKKVCIAAALLAAFGLISSVINATNIDQIAQQIGVTIKI